MNSNNQISWIQLSSHRPPVGVRVLAYSADCGGDPAIMYRIMDSQFVKYSSDVTHWAYLTPPSDVE